MHINMHTTMNTIIIIALIGRAPRPEGIDSTVIYSNLLCVTRLCHTVPYRVPYYTIINHSE